MIYSAYLLPYTVETKRNTVKGIITTKIDLWRIYVKERSSVDSDQYITKTRVVSTYKEAREILSGYAQQYHFTEIVLFAQDDPTTIEFTISDDNDELYAFLKYND